jgi:hypothetical protein
MKEDKKKAVGTDRVMTGRVVKGPFGGVSKSAHEAIYLETESGEKLKLVRVGGNPFNDPELNKLVGKIVQAKGKVVDYQLMAKEIGPV